uniref:REJ domain-containing protein n=1 Tax=Globodera pallida TaxID=36090 RepID=A0A183BQF4_GLOPA
MRVRCLVEEPALAFIFPQAAPIKAVAGANRSIGFVSAFGASFPKGLNGRYNCLFGTSLSKGRWVSPSLVQCPVPTQSLTGKYAFNMVPDGSTAYIPNQADGGTSHFTLFVSCSPDECRGRCLGPICLCLHSQSGNLCEVTPPTTENSTIVKIVSNNNTAVTWATEFQPYTTKIPNWVEYFKWHLNELSQCQDELSLVSVQSDIGVGLIVDLLNGTLYWPSPLGRLRPYSIEVRLQAANGTNSLVKWALRVKPSYSAQLDRAESFAENSNGRAITGKVIWKGAKAAFNGSIPLLLRILASESERRYVVEDIILWTEPSVDGQKFRYVLYPYLNASEIAIIPVHPGAAFADSPQTLDETDAVEWAHQRVAVGGFDAELNVREGQSFEHNYSLRMAPLGGNCSGQWHFERDGESVRLSFRPLLSLAQSTAPSAASLMLKTAFICMPMGQSQIIRQTLKGIGTKNSRREDGLGVAMDPQRLFVDVAGGVPSQSFSVFTLDVSVPGRRAELLQRVHLESASFSPFELVWLSRPSPTFWRLWLSLKADQMGQEGNSDGVLLIRGGENLALSLPYRIQRTSNAQSDAFLFTLTVKDSSSKAKNAPGHPLPATAAADVQLFTQRNGQHFFRTVSFDEQFGPLRSDIFQLRIRSRQFRPFSSLIKVDPLNNALIVELRRMPTQYFADDGKTFAVEWEELDGTAIRPRVRLSPLAISDANLQQFVDIVYTDGPPKSFVWLSPNEHQPLMGLIGHLKPFRAGIQSMFPALSLVESQLISFPTLLGEFLSQLSIVLSPSALLPLSSPAIFDQFIAAIADNSTEGPIVEGNELRGRAEELIGKWNRVVNLVSGRGEDDLPEGSASGRELAQWRALVQSADRIKSIVRQFGAENPFSLFKDVLRRIFSNAEFHSELNPTPEDYQTEEIVGWADVRAEREEVQEGEEFRVLVNVRVRELTPAVLSSVSVNLRFTRTSAPLKFRLGPIFSSGQPLELRADGTFRAEWTVLPLSDFRLTKSISVKPDIVLSFELGGERKAQRLNAPSVLIRPRPALRLLAFSLPTLSMASSAHSLHISAVNSGYSELNSVEFRQLQPEIRWANDGTPVDFRFSNVHVEGPDGHTLPEGSFLSFGHKIASGSASHMTLNISVMPHKTNSVALFHNFSAVVSVNSSLLPLSQFDLRFFFIQQSVRPHSLLLVSDHSSPLPLYLYSKPDSKLTPLATLQLIEEKEIRSVLNGHRFLSRVYALRRLGLFSSPMGPDGASTFADGAKLLRVSEISENRKRQIDRQLVWIGGDSDEKMANINFVDLDASASMPQLVYELLFGRPEHFRAPFFSQAVYQLQLDVPSSISLAGHQEVLGRITAISPQDSPLNYSVWSPQKESPFSVVPSTGDIVITHPLPTGSAEHCLNLVATDQKGMQTRVPVQILLEAVEQSGNRQGIASEQGECKLYSVETKLFEHKFEKTRYQTTEEAAAEAFSNKTLADEAQSHQHSPPRPNVVEIGGDSTLSPISFSPDVEVTAEERDEQSNNGTFQEEATATPAVPSSPAPFAAVGVSPTAGRSFPTHSHQQFLTAYPHRSVYSTTKAPLPALQLAGLGTGSPRTAGTRRNGTGRIRIGAAGVQREEGRTVEGGQSSAQTMAEMACRLRTTKPIWALICDMAKTVYRTTI